MFIDIHAPRSVKNPGYKIPQNGTCFSCVNPHTVENCNSMVSRKFSLQKGSQRQKSLNQFKAMSACGEDLAGILKARYGKTLKTQISTDDEKAEKLVKVLGKVFKLVPRNTKLQWLAVVHSCGYSRTALVKEANWTISCFLEKC
jgi:hypothetical protein